MRAIVVPCLCILGLLVAGCTTDGAGDPSLTGNEKPPTMTVQAPADLKYFPSDEPRQLGLQYFQRGAFGTAAKYFESAVTKAPEDVQAWIDLAASYDRIGRFDLADRAYKQAIALSGETTQILNNEGYSYMLRGDLKKARSMLMAAYRRDPNDPTIVDNLQLLSSSQSFIRRDN